MGSKVNTEITQIALDTDELISALYEGSYSHTILQDGNLSRESLGTIETFLKMTFSRILANLARLRKLLEQVDP